MTKKNLFYIKFTGPQNKPRRSFSHLLEILLRKASHKIKLSERNIRHLSLEPNKESYNLLQISDDVKTRTAKEANFSHAEMRKSASSHSSCASEKPGSSTVGKRPISRQRDHDEATRLPENQVTTKTCSCKANTGLYLLVLTLFSTLFCGRARAIFFTLAFLYLLPMLAGILRQSQIGKGCRRKRPE